MNEPAVVCLACGLDVDHLDAADAAIAAAVHDELRHAGRPTAFVAEIESDRRRPVVDQGRGVA